MKQVFHLDIDLQLDWTERSLFYESSNSSGDQSEIELKVLQFQLDWEAGVMKWNQLKLSFRRGFGVKFRIIQYQLDKIEIQNSFNVNVYKPILK